MKATKRVTTVSSSQERELDCNQVVYYNVGDTVVYIDEIPIFPRGTYAEFDYNYLVCYNDKVVIKFEGDGINKLLIIEKTYYES